ncbi:MAG: ATP-binding protein [Clostridia bacterium]|nr:ATP-binding protein [Clostridia bacterium]
MTDDNKKTTVTVYLSGRIDSGNAAAVEADVFAKLAGKGGAGVILDAAELDYISSAGLRVILRVKKAYPDLTVKNVNPEVYEILEMTGFTEMMTVEKAYRTVSVEGCEVIGEGANGKVYRIDKDNVVKTYKNADALAEIQHEREVARLALILGVPTAISYDVVRVGDSYGSVFELLNARSFSKIIASEPERFDWCVSEYVKMLKKIHGITVPEGKLPSIKQKTLEAVRRIKDLLPDEAGAKLVSMTEAIPECGTMIHGDYHTKNIVLAGDEVLVIDMDTLSVGHPVFDLMRMFNAYRGYSESDPDVVLRFQGFDQSVAERFWHDSLAAYLGTKDETLISEVEAKTRCLSYACLIDWGMRHHADGGLVSLWKTHLSELLPHVDSLFFDTGVQQGDPDEYETEAEIKNLQDVIDFVNSRISAIECPAKAKMQIDVAVEEIFVNVASYAYETGTGKVTVRVDTGSDAGAVSITFSDRGIPYDPLKKEDPDVTASADEREIGGLGIFMTKKIMDEVSYEYKNGQNVLTLKKRI